MIARMVKTFVVARQRDRDRLLETLRELGVVHLQPADPQQAVPDEETTTAISRLARAVQILSAFEPGPGRPDIAPGEAADRTLRLQRESAELQSRLGGLHRQIEQLALWGDVRLEQFEALGRAGITPLFFAAPNDQVDQLQAECIQVLHPLPGKRSLVAVIDRGEWQAPEGLDPMLLPERDQPAIRAEAAEIDARLKQDAERLGELANLLGAMKAELAALTKRAEYTVALRGGLSEEHLYAIQGWVPADRAEGLSSGLSAAGVESVVQTAEPAPDEEPPTLIYYPRWARPMDGLFKILGIVPGYRELDISAAFMVALPIFAAMLISDGGYGLLFLLLPILFYRKVAAKVGPQVTQLLIVLGVLAVVWGVITASFFGVGPADLKKSAGLWRHLGEVMAKLQLLRVDTSEDSRDVLMRISFILGVIHLCVAQLWRALALFPHVAFLCRVGWAALLVGMFGVVKMFVLNDPFGWQTPYPYLLIAGGTLAVLFASPSRNVFKMVGLGLAKFPLSFIGTFSDIMSYVRLMAVGLASTVLAISFNGLALGAHWVLMVPILLFGHALNIGLCLIALFAHGIRLNVLEFSNNVGMEWTGHAYQPFASQPLQEN